MSSRQPQKTGLFIKGISRIASIVGAVLTPGSVFRDAATGFYYLTGDSGILMPLFGQVNPITSVAADGVLIRRTGGVALVTDVGGGAFQARVRCTLYRGTTNAAVQGVLKVATGADASGVSVSTGTGIVPPFAGNESTLFAVRSDASGVIDFTVTYNAGGAKPLMFEYGPDQYNAAFTVS